MAPSVRATFALLLCSTLAFAGPDDERLKALGEKKDPLTASEVDELLAIASRGDHRNDAVNRRDMAVTLLSKQKLTAAQGDTLARRLAVPGGETEDFVRVRIPAIVAASGTQNFVTHVTLAKQVAAGGPPALMRNTLAALETLKPVDPSVAELLARTGLNGNQRIDVRRRSLAIAGAMPAEPGKERDFLEGALLQAAKDPETREVAVSALRSRKLSDETSGQIARNAAGNGPDAGWSQEVLRQQPGLAAFQHVTAGTGRFADRHDCLGYMADVLFRRAQ